jgi:hypothetical protein
MSDPIAYLLVIIFNLIWLECVGQGIKGGSDRIMFYNVENLFYPEDDSLTADDEFTPGGIRHWTWKRYHHKITALTKVIIAAGEGDPPAVIGLCEIENDAVLSDIVEHPLLRNYRYHYIHRDGPDPRGIDVALLYRPGFKPVCHSFHQVYNASEILPSREILYVRGVIVGGDTIDLFVNHWSSRYGGEATSAWKRGLQAHALRQLMDSLSRMGTSDVIIAMGDFNDESTSWPVQRIMELPSARIPVAQYVSGYVAGSYKYHGRWQHIDHFVVIDPSGERSYRMIIFSLPHILEDDENYSGKCPSRTYIGYRYHGGLSDHLPVILQIVHHGEDQGR